MNTKLMLSDRVRAEVADAVNVSTQRLASEYSYIELAVAIRNGCAHLDRMTPLGRMLYGALTALSRWPFQEGP